MKNRLTLLAALTTALIMFNGCIVTSINPLYTEDDIVFDEALIGSWTDGDDGEDGDELWTFEKGEKNGYRLVVYGDNTSKKNFSFSLSDDKEEKEEKVNDTVENTIDVGKFDAYLVKLGDHIFLDMYPVLPEEGSFWYYLHTVPVHSFMKVSIEGDILNLSFLDLDWFSKKIESDEGLDLEYVIAQDGDTFILSAPTDKLQEFLLKNAENAEMFEKDELKRYK